jgi:hypothetical protein
MGRVASAKYGTKKLVFASPEMSKAHTKSDLRNMIEEPPAPNVVNIKRA